MVLILCEAMERLNTTEADFFRLAHIFTYACEDKTDTDFIQWKVSGIIPLYCIEYATHVLENES